MAINLQVGKSQLVLTYKLVTHIKEKFKCHIYNLKFYMTNWLLIFVTSSHCFEWQLILPSLLNCKTRYSLTTFQYFQLTGWSILLSWEIAYVQMSAWLAAVISKLKKPKILLIFSRLIRLCFVGYESGGNVFLSNNRYHKYTCIMEIVKGLSSPCSY